MPPTCHWHRRTRQLTGDVRSAARGRTPEDQIADTADHRSAQGVRTRLERYECDPAREIDAQSDEAYLALTKREAYPVAPATVPFTLNHERSARMFTRIVELTSESGKAKELANTINEKVLPILRNNAASSTRPSCFRTRN